MRKIALCHLESITCLPAINRLFVEFGDRIGLVVVSERFGGDHGGIVAQFFKNVRRSGLRMTLWLGFDLISAQVIGATSRLIPVDESTRLLALQALARRYQATVIRTADINSSAIIDQLKAYEADLLLVMNFDQILRAPVISAPRLGVLNIHPSLLPDLRGPCPVFQALAEGRRKSGVTIHVIDDDRIDSGPIVHQVEVDIDSRQSVAETNTRLFLEGVAGLPAALASLPFSDRHHAQSAAAGSYQGFPASVDVARARHAGVRLFSARHVWRLIVSSLGFRTVFNTPRR